MPKVAFMSFLMKITWKAMKVLDNKKASEPSPDASFE